MHICIVQNVSLMDHLGLSTYLKSISMYLPQEPNDDISIIVQKSITPVPDLPENLNLCEIDSDLYSIKGNIKFVMDSYNKLKEINRSKPIDIIHCLYPNSALAAAILFKRKSPKTKIIYDLRSPWIDMSIDRGSIPAFIAPFYRRIAYFMENLLSRKVDGFIFITEGLKKFYENKIRLNLKPVKIIPSGIDLNNFSRKDPQIIRNKYKIGTEDFLLGYVGAVAASRELDFVMRSFAKSLAKNRNYKLMFVGDGNDKEHLEQLSEDLNIQDNVIFAGKIPYKDISYYISAFNVGICHLPDKFVYRYSFPMKILEYLACGTPVLASNIEAHREIGKNLDNVYVYNNEGEFFECLEILNDNKVYRNFLFSKIENYSWPNLCNQISKFYYLLNS